MRILTVAFAAVVLSASALSQSKSAFPSDGNDLLNYCGEVVNYLDSPAPQADDEKELKFGWCVGYLQATDDRIENWRIAGAIQVMTYQKDGKPAPSHMWADENFANTCIPGTAPMAQLARIVVKWLREHPERLHESKSVLVMDALRDAFPCEAPIKPPVVAKPDTP